LGQAGEVLAHRDFVYLKSVHNFLNCESNLVIEQQKNEHSNRADDQIGRSGSAGQGVRNNTLAKTEANCELALSMFVFVPQLELLE
jgi:hypothetical protein